MLQKSIRYWQALEDDSHIILFRKCGFKDYFEVNVRKKKAPTILKAISCHLQKYGNISSIRV